MELNEGIEKGSSSHQSDGEEPKKRHRCEWKNCPKPKMETDYPHRKEPEYPKNGDLTRASSYQLRKNVSPDELLPFSKDGEQHTFAVHHLVPVVCFKSFSDLTHNADLSGYDVNERSNLIALPNKVAGAEATGLQYHAGGHGLRKSKLREEGALGNAIAKARTGVDKNYRDFVLMRLKATEKLSLTRCAEDREGTSKPQVDFLLTRLRMDEWAIRSAISSRKILLVKGK